jgi:hypothetical protein
LVRSFAIIAFLAILAIPSQAATVLYSQNFEGGAIPGQFYGGTLLNTSGVPSAVGDGNWALWNDAGGTPQGTTGMPIGLQLNGLKPFTSASLDFTFLAIDSWDGVDYGSFSPDYFTVQVNPKVVFQAPFRNYLTTEYAGDGNPGYGSAPPPNSTITLLLAANANYLVTDHFNDAFYQIHIDGLQADAQGNLNIYFYACGAGWQGGYDESFGVDNIVVTGTDPVDPVGPTPQSGDTPEPGTWLTLSAGFGLLLGLRHRQALLSYFSSR